MALDYNQFFGWVSDPALILHSDRCPARSDHAEPSLPQPRFEVDAGRLVVGEHLEQLERADGGVIVHDLVLRRVLEAIARNALPTRKQPFNVVTLMRFKRTVLALLSSPITNLREDGIAEWKTGWRGWFHATSPKMAKADAFAQTER